MTARLGYGWARFWACRHPEGGVKRWVLKRRVRLAKVKSLRTGRRVWDV